MKKIWKPSDLAQAAKKFGVTNDDLVIAGLRGSIYLDAILLSDKDKLERDISFITDELNDVSIVVVRGANVDKISIDFYNSINESLNNSVDFLDFLLVDYDKETWTSDMCEDEDCCPSSGHSFNEEEVLEVPVVKDAIKQLLSMLGE